MGTNETGSDGPWTGDGPMRRTGRACFLLVGQGTLRTVELADKPEHLIGADPSADVCLPDPAVARQHAVLKLRPRGRTTIVPVSMDCPVLVNLRFVEAPTALSDGDIVSIGATTLTFHEAPRRDRHPVHDAAAFRERLARRMAVCDATGSRLTLLTLDLAPERAGETAQGAIEEMCAMLHGDDIVGWDGDTRLQIAFWFPQGTPDRACERLCQAVHRHVPVVSMGRATFPDEAADEQGLIDASRRTMRPVEPPQAPHVRTQVRTLKLADHPVRVLDPAMRRLFDSVECFAATDLPVLIQGETGVGKEIVARALHEWSPRREKPLVTINCAAIADTLVENELFGHEAGAFTGAGGAKAGLLEAADGGTVFLDETGECTPRIQAKLLRVLETRRVSRLGSVRECPIDVRWVAATNRDLKREVADGRFRSDLLFRLNTAAVQVPPLRSRRVEIPLLTRTFLEVACIRTGRPVPAVSVGVTRALVEYGWPGNVRELRNLMEYLAATSDGGTIDEHRLPPAVLGRGGSTREPNAPSDLLAADNGQSTQANMGWADYAGLYDEIRTLEERRIREALAATAGVRVEAAKLLDMPLRTLHTRIREYAIDLPPPGPDPASQ
jgi:DNA-binding NtrC family response regulator